MMRATPSEAAPTHSPLSPIPLSKDDLVRFRRALLRWYDRNRRDLPWRNTRDPYRIWLSEIMLQQTRVAAVLDHYRMFLERFPSVQTLAAASEDDVLAAWSGLGYYRRARMLHRCARQVAAEYAGNFPQHPTSLLQLPGIGRYTAAAIASIAFDEPIAVVDGNVERVLQRFTGINLRAAQTWSTAQALLFERRPGDHNQAMMELGATVCQPRAPRCKQCPVRRLCVTEQAATRTTTRESRLPPDQNSPSMFRAKILPMKVRQAKRNIWCILSQRKGSIRLVQRPKRASVMPGMWELPQSAEPPRLWPTSSHWRTFRHSITVTDYTVHVSRSLSAKIALRRGFAPPRPKATKAKWIAIDRIPQIPITGLTRKILKAGGVI